MIQMIATLMGCLLGYFRRGRVKRIFSRLLNTIHVHVIDQTLRPFKIKGALAQKVHVVSARGVHFSRHCVVLPDAIPPEYMQYLVELYGDKAPKVVVPDGGHTNLDKDLDLGQMLLDDYESLVRVRDFGIPFSAYTVGLKAHKIAGALPLYGPSAEVMAEVADAGNKHLECARFSQLGIQAKEGRFCQAHDVIAEAACRLAKDGAVFLCHPHGDGGLGNLPVFARDLAPGQHIGKYLEAYFADPTVSYVHDFADWAQYGIEVQRCYEVDGSPAAFVHIDRRGKVRVVDVHDQLQNARGDCIGIIYCPRDTVVRERYGEKAYREMRHHARLVGQMHARQGIRDTCLSVDFMNTRQHGRFGCETNMRMTAMNVIWMIATRLDVLHQPCATNDQFKLREEEQMSFEFLYSQLINAGLAWNPKTKRGVIITIPPTQFGTVGFFATAKTHEDIKNMYIQLENLFGIVT